MNLSGEFLDADGHIESFKFPEAEAIKRLVVFPWEAQLREAELLKKCSPTVSLEYPGKARLLWASVIEKHKNLSSWYASKKRPVRYAQRATKSL